MSQDVTLMGASYSDVPAVVLPKTGGGDATFTDVSDTTAAASDVASGKYFYTAAGVKTAGTSSGGGGGGSSRVVTGTFQSSISDAGNAIDVSVPYSGSGYPLVVVIYPTPGVYNSNSAIYDLIQRYVIISAMTVKSDTSTTPDYSDVNDVKNQANTCFQYKNSTSNKTTMARTGVNSTGVYDNTSAGASNANFIKIKAKDKLSVFIASTSYGFAANIEYTYVIYYSS